MGLLQYEFRECTDPGCRFRFPAPANAKLGDKCPRCGAIVQVVIKASFEPENNPDSQPNVGNQVEGINQTAGSYSLPPHSTHFLAALIDNIRSTWNVGSMLRTADGAGIRHLYLCGISPTPEHPHVTRTALGAEHSIPWSWHPNSIDLAKELLGMGYQLWALEAMPGAVPIYSAPPLASLERVALVIGNEIAGIDPGLLALCQACFWIPMRGVKRSLNAAVAFGIAAYTLQGESYP
jgi:23S rRNA (guanosine2251-2'-O)-methyltransferase